MIISYQLSTQQRHETASFCHYFGSLQRLFCWCLSVVLFWMVMLRIYYLRSKVSNSMYCSVVKNLVSIKILKKKVNILNLEIEIQGEPTVAKNKDYAFRFRYFVMRVWNHRTFKFRSLEIRNYETTIDLTHDKSWTWNFNFCIISFTQNSELILMLLFIINSSYGTLLRCHVIIRTTS